MRGVGRCILVTSLLALAGCFYDWTVVPKDDKPPGGKGGCSSNGDCEDDAYCVFSDALCGKGVAGACKPRPSSCETDETVLCFSCSGSPSRRSQCSLGQSGEDVSGSCK